MFMLLYPTRFSLLKELRYKKKALSNIKYQFQIFLTIIQDLAEEVKSIECLAILYIDGSIQIYIGDETSVSYNSRDDIIGKYHNHPGDDYSFLCENQFQFTFSRADIETSIREKSLLSILYITEIRHVIFLDYLKLIPIWTKKYNLFLSKKYIFEICYKVGCFKMKNNKYGFNPLLKVMILEEFQKD